MHTKRIMLLVVLVAALAGCGGSSKSPATVTVTAPPAAPAPEPGRFTPAQVRSALKRYGVATRSFHTDEDPACIRMLLSDDTGIFRKGAWIMVSPNAACDQLEADFKASGKLNVMRLQANVWEESFKNATVQDKFLVQAYTLAAMIKYL